MRISMNDRDPQSKQHSKQEVGAPLNYQDSEEFEELGYARTMKSNWKVEQFHNTVFF